MMYKAKSLIFIFQGLFLITLSSLLKAESNEGAWYFAIDNDFLSNSDDHYTNGFQVGWVSGYLTDYDEGPVPSFIAEGLNNLPLVNKPGQQRFISHSVSHRIFTPSDTNTSAPIHNDIPYSGLLFAELTAGAQDETTMDAFTFTYGIAGPSAQGEEVQNGFHRLIGDDRVNGWDNQIRDEVILNIAYEHRWRIKRFGNTSGFGGDFIGQTGGSIGNLASMATIGVGARFGWGVSDDYGIPPQFFGEESIGSRPFTSKDATDGFWFFTLLNGSYFANAIFWDGNTFKDSMSVDYDPGILRLYLGVIGRKGDFSMSFSIVKTTVPWETPNDRNHQSYGRISVNYNF